MESLGFRLKQLRKQKKLTQVELGKQIGVTGVAIGYWEKDLNEPGSKALSKLARALGTTDSYLLYGLESHSNLAPMPKGIEIPLLTLGEAITFLILEGDRAMDKFQKKIITFLDARDGDFAVEMPDDTMLNPSGSPSIPAGATVILRPGEKFENGSVVAVIVQDPLSKKPTLTIKKLVVDGQNIYLTPLNPRYAPSLLVSDYKIVAVAKGVQYNL